MNAAVRGCIADERSNEGCLTDERSNEWVFSGCFVTMLECIGAIDHPISSHFKCNCRYYTKTGMRSSGL